MNSVQQSGAVWALISYVPICWARSMISILSVPMSGRKTGIVATSLVAVMFSRVCEATCPSDSPVTSALAPSSSATFWATSNMRRRYMMTRRLCGALSEISRWHSPNGTT